MKKIPSEIKNKLRQYAKSQQKTGELYGEVQEMLETYDLDVDNFLATGDGNVQTEALAFINNCECDNIESTISEIEKVFLYYVNKEMADCETDL